MFNACTIFTHIISNIIYIIAHCILIIFIIVNMILVSIVELKQRNIALYLIIFFITIILAILGGILICYVQRKDPAIQVKIKILTMVSLIITILLLVFTIVEEIIVSIDYSKIQKPKCFIDKVDPLGVVTKKSNQKLKINSNLKRNLFDEDDITGCIDSYILKTSKRYSYTTLTFIEIISIISIIYWIQNKKKHADQPMQIPTPIVPNTRQVVINPIQVPLNNAVVVSPGQQYYPNNYPLQQNILYTFNQNPYNNNAILYNNANVNVNNGNLYNNNNYSGPLNIQNNNNPNYNNNYPVQQNEQNNNNIQQNNGNINIIPKYALDKNVIINENSSDRQNL